MDVAIMAARSKRAKYRGSNRNTIRMAGIMVLVLGMAAALLAMQYVASEFVGSHHAPAPVAQEQPAPGGEK